MTKKRRTYTREFKLEAVHLWQTSGKSAAQIERELGIGSGNLYRWKRELIQEGQSAFPGQGCLGPEEERIRQLERENEILRQERDILKKATSTACGASEWPSSRTQADEIPVHRRPPG